ncbi:unnamed protein product [Heterobilharzia americana]|nr:unnamed protein product [Heterobilharzia americana]
MPKYCVEFVDGVSIVTSRNNSDCLESKTEDNTIQNNCTLPIKTDPISPFHDLNKSSTSLHSEEDKPITTTKTTTCTTTSTKTKIQNIIYPKNSHEIPMGKTACYMPDSLKSTCEYHYQKPIFNRQLPTVEKYSTNCRKFVISRAVKYEDE